VYLFAWYPRISSVCLAARLAAFYALHLPLFFSIVQNLACDLTPTLHHRRSISYDDHSNCSHMPMLTKFMTCIFPPSYFLFPFLFVCVPSIYSLYSSLPSSYVCAYLSPSIFCLSSSPSAKPISYRTLCYIQVYPIPDLPPTRQSCHIPRHQISGGVSIRQISFSFPILSFPLHHLTSSPTRPLLPKTNGYILVTFFFPNTHITSSYSTPPYGTACLLTRLVVSSPYLLFYSDLCSLRSAL